MIKLFLLTVVSLTLMVSTATGNEVVISAGTELSANSKSDIDSSTMKIGDDANFVLSADVAGVTVTIPKGSELFGRIVEVEKFGNDSGESRIVIMFDFLQVGEEFYSIQALVVSLTGASGVKVEKSKDFVGGTKCSTKGAETKIAKGTSFKLKVINDVTND